MESSLFERTQRFIKKVLDNHYEVRYKLIKKSEIPTSGGLAPRILSISCKVVDVRL